MDTVSMLTTIDNPFNPFTQYEEWYNYDVSKGYNTCSYLARIAKTSDELSDADEFLAIDQAIDEIVKFDLLGNYIKVQEDYVPRMVTMVETS
jgi:hypothetical protein